ncbi:MAG TPA: 1-deoxy-D-xylulose-5-phosphate reductoisomerase, partial [Planctomycetota bacterium]|nr:1-deoxy-D-xylulose-5-phosphate reductoisomerase [Planctomycetota bacterium]
LLLGSTGSIGESTLRVAENLGEAVRIVALAAHSRWERLLEQIDAFSPEAVALTDSDAAAELERALAHRKGPIPRLYVGSDGLVSLVRETTGDIVVAAISGAAGLPATIAAVETGKDLALANKESLVMSGAILTRLAEEHGKRILPVDSEHSAIFQCMQAGRPEEIRAIVLTASGGPFRSTPLAELESVTPAQALAHPTWNMGAKITIDSATLMNKSLEVIEAFWLFDIEPRSIEVVVHPQSIVHSMVEYRDGSTIAHLGPPDMRVPIQYALTYPRREALDVPRLRWSDVARLTFEAPDLDRFPSLRMAYEVLEAGGTSAAVFNGANEVAVAAFLAEELPFLGIFEVIERTLERHSSIAQPSLADIFQADAWAREEAQRQAGALASRRG